jgi:Ca2+-binding RTX toxin-like protein
VTQYWGTDAGEVIIGSGGPDIINAGNGGDTIDGGDGDDVITDGAGTVNRISGGGGDDTIRFTQNFSNSVYTSLYATTTISGGDGNDSVFVDHPTHGFLSVDLGTGNDFVELGTDINGYRAEATLLTLGAGSDRVKLSFGAGIALAAMIEWKPIVITDFQAGASGDVLDIIDLLLGFYHAPAETTVFPAANPFASGHLELIQDGADTIVRLDADGSGPGTGIVYTRDLFRLTGVDASALTSFNFAGFNPSGANNVAVDVAGTSGADTLYAGAYGSIVNGLGGNDHLFGTGGSDDLRGGDGDDVIDGGWNADRLIGGDGNDILDDHLGSNWYDGGAGDDIIRFISSEHQVADMAVHDDLVIFGGDGNDRVQLQITLGDRPNVGGSHTATAFVDLGAGDDRLQLHNWLITPTVTLGAGQDRVTFDTSYIVPSKDPYGPVVITDFQTGAGGDVLDLAGAIYGFAGNGSLSTQYLHADQEGADTSIYLGDILLVRLLGVQPASLTAYNLGGLALDGSVVDVVHTGTANADLIDGGAGNDQLNGGGGNDEIYGGFGNDTIDGGIGNDRLYGGYGSDTLNGGDGDDVIEDVGDGASTVNGGDGNDSILVQSTRIDGAQAVAINAGNGNDDVRFASYHDGGTVTIDLGAGDDRLTISSTNEFDAPLRVTMGSGQDMLVMDPAAAVNGLHTPIEITDFQTGDAGDRIDWLAYAQSKMMIEGDPDSFDPFEFTLMLDNVVGTSASLVQSGADTLLKISDTTLIVFRNTSVGSFTDFNLGIVTKPTALTGGASDDALTGTDSDDTVSGLAGNDILRGRYGNDTLNGGDGADRLIGGAGNDTLNGGAGRDHVDGGTGDDKIGDSEGIDTLIGGLGDDVFDVVVSAVGPTAPVGSLDAGRGDDVVNITGGSGYQVTTGSGIDVVTVRAGSGETSVNLGVGGDVLDVHRLTGDLTVTLGGGDDYIRLQSDFGTAGQGVIRVTDFEYQYGHNDSIEFSSYLKAITGGAWTIDVNPFEAGYAQLKMVAGGTEVWFNPSGHPGSDSVLAVFLEGVNPSGLTHFNFAGYDPLAAFPKPHLIDGAVQNPQGTTISSLNDGYVENVRSAFVFQTNGGGADSFVNSGTVKMLEDGSDGGPGGMAGVYVTFPGSDAHSSFYNTATGSFIVESQAVGDVGPFIDPTYGFYLPSGGDVSFRNDGLFEVHAARSYAIGIETYQNTTIVNNGTLRVDSADSAIGISHAHSSLITNTGLIDVHGASYAIGIEFQNLDPGGFVNAGTIRAATDPGSQYASIGLAIWQNSNLSAPTVIRNSGTIDADIAIYVNYKFGVGTNYDSAERVENSGTIHGDVYLSYGDDQVINTGLMTGVTTLESGNDFYDGRSGEHDGLIDGGGGDDRILGGAHADTIDGGRGNDMIIAGGGDDTVYEGSGGNDAIDGGAGFDTIDFLDAWQGVSVDLASEIVLNGATTSHVRAFEAVIGSGFADTLKGSAVGEVLEGAAGDDMIDGRDGDDVLYGDSGADTLTGGAGNDRFLFSRGDGADTITDLSAGDRIEIYGYDTYLSLEQVGSSVRINLSATDSILVANATPASLTAANLTFHHDQLSPEPAAIATDFLRVDDVALVIAPGTTLNLTATDFQDDQYALGLRQAAIWIETTRFTGQVWNGGQIIISADASAAPLTGFIRENPIYTAGGYQGINSEFHNLAGGVFQVIGHHGDVQAIEGPVENAGTILAFADGGDAIGVYGSSQLIANWGTISAQASGAAWGISQSRGGFYNEGSIVANGGSASVGAFVQFGASVATTTNMSVNTGQITVTDGTSWMDSIGLKLDAAVGASFWNTGTVKADFAMDGGAREGSTFTVYNSGTLDGIVRAGAGADQLYNSGSITGPVSLQGGNDLYDGRLGHVNGSVSGGDGDDFLFGGVQDDILSGGAGSDVITGGHGNDTLTGGQGSDRFVIAPGDGHDQITDFQAGAGGDVIAASGYSNYASLTQQGADVLVTFSASDTILLHNVQASALVAANFQFDVHAFPAATALPPPPAAPAAPTAPVETAAATFQYYGTAADDVLVGGAGTDEFFGEAGADQMFGKGGNDIYHVDRQDDLVFESANEGTDTVISTASYYLYANVENLTLAVGAGAIFGVGNEADNLLIGNESANLLLGGAGNDSLFGGNGGDQLYGQDGVDTLFGEGGVDYLIGGAGNDVLFGGDDGDALYGEDGDDVLWGGEDFKTDIMIGGAGNDTFHADSGWGDYDLLDGGAGDDIYDVDTYADVTYEAVGGGTDTVYAGTAAGSGYYLYANVENLVLTGQTFYGVGNELANTMTGNALDNWLLGGAGNDILNGKAGNDVLFGQDGADTFVFEHGTGADTIADFTPGTDHIDLSAFGFTSFAQVQAAMVENGGSSAIVLGNGDLIVLQNVTNAALHAGDFILTGGSAAEVPAAALLQGDAAGGSGIAHGRADMLHALDAYASAPQPDWMSGSHVMM